jgi:hypothetical protein
MSKVHLLKENDDILKKDFMLCGKPLSEHILFETSKSSFLGYSTSFRCLKCESIVLYVPKKGDLFEWCDDQFWCIESGAFSGVVNPVGETYYLRGFMWNFGGEPPRFIRKATKDEYDYLFNKLL